MALLSDGRVLVGDGDRRRRVYTSDGAAVSDLALPVRVMSFRTEADRLVALPSLADEAAPPMLIGLTPLHFIARLEGHRGQVFSARWVAGNRVLTAGADGTAKL